MKRQAAAWVSGLMLAAGLQAADNAPQKAVAPIEPLVNLVEEAKKYGVDGKATPSPAKAKEEKKTAQAHAVQWSYSGKTGPAHWGELDEKFILCKIGRNQSPVDIRDRHAVDARGLPSLDVVYGTPQFAIINTGHTVQVNYPVGNSYIKLNNHRYELLQFHFHTPSEHQLAGFNYPMEMHLVHRDGDGNLAVIGILFKEGAFNPELQKVIDRLPKTLGKVERHKQVQLDLRRFFPADTRFYKYSGSLTTPPCTEGVWWMVFRQPIEAAPEQLAAMEKILGANNRPVQPLYARTLIKSWFDPPPEAVQEPLFYY